MLDAMAEPNDTPPTPPRRGLKRTAARAGAVAYAALRVIRVARAVAKTTLEVLLALVIVFEEWGWKPLAALLAQLARLKSIAALEAAVQALPPYPALLVFLLPSALVFPLKLLSLWLIATGHLVLAGLLFVAAKVVGTALLARIFQLTQPKLMQLVWFARVYGIFIPWKDALVARVKGTPVWQAAATATARAKQTVKLAWSRVKPLAQTALERLRGILRRR
jgi:hypothetical protein